MQVGVTPDETLTCAGQLMRDYDSHHLIVLGRGTHHPVGMISALDIADAAEL